MHLNLAHLAYVVAVAKRGSITEASVEVGISQPAISAAISGIEETYGYKLFVRNRAKGLTPTPVGRHFINRAQVLLDAASGFQNDVMGLGEQITGEVQVACYHVIAPYVLPPVVSALAKKYPEVSVRLHEGSLVEVVNTVKEGIADIALTYDMFDDSTVQLEQLLAVRPHVLMAKQHPLADRNAVSLDELAAYPFVMLDIPGVREYYQSLFRHRGIQTNVQFRAQSLEMVRSMVGMNLGYSFAMLPILNTHSYSGDVLVRCPLSHEVEAANLCLVSPKDTTPPKITKVFADICREAIVAAVEIHSRGMFDRTDC